MLFEHLDSMFNTRLSELGFTRYELGKTYLGYPLTFYLPKIMNNGPRLLLTAGFHGEEIAGPISLLTFINTCRKSYFEKFYMSFMPLVNPTGINRKIRNNVNNENPDAGFIRTGDPESFSQSKEGKILSDHMEEMVASSHDGMITLHEDNIRSPYGYTFTWEQSEHPTKFSYDIAETISKFFPLHPDGRLIDVVSVTDMVVNEGIIYNYNDGSFEDYLYQKGCKYCACPDIDQNRSLEYRVSANIEIIKTFLNFYEQI